jgi:GntR family transcriptional repressor for pyruvate dehydrogenase complex
MSKSKTTKKDEVESTVAFNQVKKVVLYEQVAKQMKAAILGGSYQPGDRLPTERELSITFGVGRPTIREALKTLSVRGLIEINREHRCYVVKSPDLEYYIDPIREQISWLIQVNDKTVSDFWEVIPHLLGIMAHSAVYREADCGPLHDCIEQMKKCRDFYSVSPFTYEFGRQLSELTGNQVVSILWKIFKHVIQEEYPPILEKRETAGPAKLIEFHQAILSAMEGRNHAAIDAAVADRREYLKAL